MSRALVKVVLVVVVAFVLFLVIAAAAFEIANLLTGSPHHRALPPYSMPGK